MDLWTWKKELPCPSASTWRSLVSPTYFPAAFFTLKHRRQPTKGVKRDMRQTKEH